ncbi:hypothetical protein M7I_3017 [Glarea lozoyensis 74030]|uniref:Uncharacterized protein n=1 Tax=Glarea lozoyensis (strain ATCC 74030 / MF5533) TaxID=1104152 RepID=H0EKC1_GLAL7|nr:hypothetical protein M7I_3017 [Glarea lozoyensis 74030]
MNGFAEGFEYLIVSSVFEMEKSAEIRTSSDEPAREVIASTSTSETPYAGPALPRWRFTCLCIGLSISLFMSLLDTTIIATALFTIGKDLRATSSRTTWGSLSGMLECQFRDNTQVRVLGGSIGIAASTAILGVNEHRSLSNMVTSQQLATLQDSLPHMTPEQVHAVKQAYSDAFAESMKVCAALGGMGVLASLVCWRRNPVEFNVRRKEQIEEDRVRREGEMGIGVVNGNGAVKEGQVVKKV